MQIKLFKKEKSFKKKNFIFHPDLYWKITVSGILVAILFSFFFGYRLFMEINREAILPAPNGSRQVETVKKDRIEEILRYFSEREKKSAEILNSPAPFVDPSL
ncbi:MAG: hypothetical protein AAB661_02025 [Patescibacteria group bacterium]